MFEEQNGVVTPRRRLDQSFGILCTAWKRDVPTRRMRVYGFDTLRVKWSAFDTPATCHTNDDRIRPGAVTAPAKSRNLVSHLHETRPRVVGKLDLDNRFISADCHASRNTDDAGLSQSRILHAVRIAVC